jgi:hypothetical protein
VKDDISGFIYKGYKKGDKMKSEGTTNFILKPTNKEKQDAKHTISI